MKKIIPITKIIMQYLVISTILFCAGSDKVKKQLSQDENLKQREQETGLQVARRTFIDSSQYVDGRFTIGTKAGQKLLYGFPAAHSTSHVIFNIDGHFASNEPDFKAFYLLGQQRIIDFSHEVAWKFKKVTITQRLTPLLKSGRGMVWIQYFLKNTDTIAHEVGLQLELDTMIGGNDAAPLASSRGIIELETQYEEDDVPDFFQAYERVTDPNSLIGQGLLSSVGATPPDFLIAGDWGSLNRVRWDEYQASGRHYGDSAVLYRWNPKKLAPGDSMFIGTYYGLGNSFNNVFDDLMIRIAGPGEINQVDNNYVPDPFEIVVLVINTGTIPLDNLNADIKLPSGLQLVSGQTTPKDFSRFRLSRDQKSSLAWRIELAEKPVEPKLYEFSVDISHAASRLQPVSVRGYIKFNPVFRVEPAPELQLIIAKRTPQQIVAINQLQVKVIDDETEQAIPSCLVHMIGADTAYQIQTNLQGEHLVELGPGINNLTKFNFDIKVKGYLPYNRTEELGIASGNIASKTFRLIRDEYELSGLLLSDIAGERIHDGRLSLTNSDTTFWIIADEQGHFSHIIKKWPQPERNSYTITIYSINHFLFIENIDFQVPRTFQQIRNFSLPYLRPGAKVVLYNVFYEQNQYLLPVQTFGELLRSATYLMEHPGIVIEISGHTSSPGSDTYNLWLSDKRAEAAMQFFEGLGIPVSRLKARGYGEQYPIADNSTSEGQAQNRRLELKVIEVLK